MDFSFENIDFTNVSKIQNAVKFYELAAQKGHLESQFLLAAKYFYGTGIQKNIDEALKWYKTAVQADDAQKIVFNVMSGEEIYDLGCEVLDSGEIEIGVQSITLAAKNGYVEAQCCLGDLYRYGQRIEKNLEQAHKWYKLAAENGDSFAQTELGKMYYNGIGVEENNEEGLSWLTRAGRGYCSKEKRNKFLKRREPLLYHKYKFVLTFQDAVGNEIEIHSDNVDGECFSSSEEQKINGVFYSSEEAQKALEKFLVLKVIVTRNHNDGEWIEEIDSFEDYPEMPIYFHSYREAESWAYSKVEDDEYDEDSENIDKINSMYEILEMEAISSEIVEIS